VVLCSAQAEAQRRQALAEVAEVIECGEQSVEPDRALAALADRGLTSVLCEGGPTLSTALLRAGLLDELCLSQALVLAGPGRAGLSAGEPFAEPVRLRLGHLLEGDDILAGRWEIVR
jgi:riboflavin biosynthesis pyrimidine reductase